MCWDVEMEFHEFMYAAVILDCLCQVQECFSHSKQGGFSFESAAFDLLYQLTVVVLSWCGDGKCIIDESSV